MSIMLPSIINTKKKNMNNCYKTKSEMKILTFKGITGILIHNVLIVPSSFPISARASPGSDAQIHRPNSAINGRGLPYHERVR